MANYRSPLCPRCLKKGEKVKMHLTRLEGLWHCKRCNHTYKNSLGALSEK